MAGKIVAHAKLAKAKVSHVGKKIANVEVGPELAHGIGYGWLYFATHEVAYASFALLAIAVFLWILNHE